MRNRLFLISLIAFSVVGAALILTLPALFGPQNEFQAELSGFLAGLALVLGITTLALRASRGTTGEGPARG
ncbi:hypothetical protein AC792_10180 [Arthrobacter sp. RIT-PI-e]|uniref:hypothetical protein n=1 Tax=Arthrobacter sp. RIT-PI-e TaxID=1681197 RepID=UPI0006760D6A|nr:hypothetical protein [Arthrobacter sp. RIT-PI-e]KNC18781.1 hypothetical protein AC792_10180 [Arthrobacter sp. RIT-PI-e]